jgi:hypothetical protein
MIKAIDSIAVLGELLVVGDLLPPGKITNVVSKPPGLWRRIRTWTVRATWTQPMSARW